MTRTLCFLALLFSCSFGFSQAAATPKQTPAPTPAAAPAPAASPAAAPAADLWVGKWKLDVAKSKFHDPAPKQETLTVDAASKSAIKYSTKGTAADGSPYTETFQGKADGKEYSLFRNGQPVARVSYHRNTDHNYTGKGATAQGAIFVESVTLAGNGQTITIKQHSSGKDGDYDQVFIFRKM